MPRIILASASPRRQELLRQLIPQFEVVHAEVDEEALTRDDPWETAKGLALAKAESVLARHPDALVIGGDTVVAIGESWLQLAKPSDAEDAARMLRLLSGREHVVITGLAVVGPGIRTVDAATTRVLFRAFEAAEINEYVATGEPMGKAGAYAIQGGAAGFVSAIEGSWSNVVGLPMELLERMLQALPHS